MTQPLSWNEIQNRSVTFAKNWVDAYSEEADAKPFWLDFFKVFGVEQRKVSSFEHHVQKYDRNLGKMDLFWPGSLVIEHKSDAERVAFLFGLYERYSSLIR